MGNSRMDDQMGQRAADRPAPAAASMAHQVVRGTAWNLVGTVAQLVLAWGATIVVARLLSPTDYAVYGMAAAFIGFFLVLAGQGFALALVQRKELTEMACHSVFWFMAALSLIVAGAAVAASPLAARFYEQPLLVPVVAVLAVGLVINMLGAVPNALLQRALRFREINLVGILGSLLTAALGVGTALLGYGYWALILPSLGSSLFMAVRAFWLSGYRPAFRFRWAEIRSVAVFGLSSLGSSLVQYFGDNSDYLIMGRFWPKADYGQYYFAFEKSRRPFSLIMMQLDRVLFPVFSRIQDDKERLRRAFVRGTRSVCLVVFPLHVLLIGLADPLVPWIFGPQWRPAVPVFQVYASLAFSRGLAALVSSGLLAINRAQINLAYNIFRVLFTVPALLALGFSGGTILQTAIVLTIIWTLQIPVFIGYFYRQLNLTVIESWRTMRGLIGVTLLMAALLLACRFVAAAAGWPAWAMVSLATLLPSAAFALLARRSLMELFRQVWTALAGRRRPADRLAGEQ